MDGPPPELTLAEIHRTIERNHKELRDAVNGLGQRIETRVRKEVFNEVITGIREDLTETRNSMRWAWRTAIASLVLPVIVALTVFLVLAAANDSRAIESKADLPAAEGR